MKHIEIIANDWDKCSDNYFSNIYSGYTLKKIIEDPVWVFPPEVWRMFCAAVPNIQGKSVLVPSSGDNGAVFAFHLLGARVTSCDISERQLYNAKQIAGAQGWDIEFIHDDSMMLGKIRDREYDLVYTSNGVHIWINDLGSMYRNFNRVLKPGGGYIMFETHPFIRPFDGEAEDNGRFMVKKRYDDIYSPGAMPKTDWRTMDLVNAMISSGFTVKHMEEFHPNPGAFDSWWYKTPGEAEADNFRKYDWRQNPWAAIPQWIGFSAKKEDK